jgi:hypothetical protein
MQVAKASFLYLSFILLQFSSVAQSSASRMHLATTDDARVAIALTIDDLPDQTFIFTIPEVFTLRGSEGGQGGLGSFAGQQWKITDDGATVYAEDKDYKYSIQLGLAEKKMEYSLNWKISFQNKSDHTLYDLAAFNCVSMKAAPLFKDDLLERTWVKDMAGNKKLIRDVAKTQGEGRRTMQFYPAKGGVKDLSKSFWLQQWDVNSKETLSGNRVYIVSKDAKWTVDTKVDGQVAYFFNNFEKTHGCIHAAPLLSARLKPGRTAVASGSINLIKQ